MPHVAFLGTGLLGSGMVENLLRRRHTVTVWNRTEAKARRLEGMRARVADTPDAAVADADRVHMTPSGRRRGRRSRRSLRTGAAARRHRHRPLDDAAGSDEGAAPAHGAQWHPLPARMDEAIAEGHGADDLGVIAAAVVQKR
ncbi:MAG TPA: NAD(P)-binding domain-containing protein [Vicinamibacterales bacterium]